ncbi:hypothetical protein ACWD1Z_37675 [Streptomyces sp. NPDC002784]
MDQLLNGYIAVYKGNATATSGGVETLAGNTAKGTVVLGQLAPGPGLTTATPLRTARRHAPRATPPSTRYCNRAALHP